MLKNYVILKTMYCHVSF